MLNLPLFIERQLAFQLSIALLFGRCRRFGCHSSLSSAAQSTSYLAPSSREGLLQTDHDTGANQEGSCCAGTVTRLYYTLFCDKTQATRGPRPATRARSPRPYGQAELQIGQIHGVCWAHRMPSGNLARREDVL